MEFANFMDNIHLLNPAENNKNVIVIGKRGVGKSYLINEIAKKLKLQSYDKKGLLYEPEQVLLIDEKNLKVVKFYITQCYSQYKNFINEENIDYVFIFREGVKYNRERMYKGLIDPKTYTFREFSSILDQLKEYECLVLDYKSKEMYKVYIEQKEEICPTCHRKI